MVPSSHPFWDYESLEQGAIRHARDRAGAQYCPDLLLVFIHGVLSDYQACWQDLLPRFLVENLGLEANVFSFSYPSRLKERAGVPAAAEKLMNDLALLQTKTFQSVRSIVFITHSTGGLVVKDALRNSFDPLLDRLSSLESWGSELRAPWLITRYLINFDVPHNGGAWFFTKVANLLYPIYYALVIAPISGPVNKLRSLKNNAESTRFELGPNQIVKELEFQNSYLYQLENDYFKEIDDLARRFLPHHASRELLANLTVIEGPKELKWAIGRDGIQVFRGFDGHRRMCFRAAGNHSLVKTPASPDHLTVKVLGYWLDKYKDPSAAPIAATTLNTLITTPRLRVDRLAGPIVNPVAHDDGFAVVSQRQALGMLRKIVSERPNTTVLLSGEAALGKSSVLRVLTQVACNDYFNETGDAAPLPIYAPLQQSGGDDQSGGVESEIRRWAYSDPKGRTSLWDAFLREWVKSANEYIGRDVVTVDWLEGRFKKKPIVLIFDGLDELLQAVSPLELIDIQNMIGTLRSRYAGNSRVTVILGVRYTQRNIGNLIGLVSEAIRLRPLDERSALEVFPWLEDYIKGVENDQLKRFFFLPHIASLLRARSAGSIEQSALSPGGDGPPRPATTEMEITDLAVTEHIKYSGLCTVKDASGNFIDVGRWREAIEFIAFLFFSQRKQVLTKAEIQRAAAAEGLKIVANDELFKLLVSRTFFVSVGRQSPEPSESDKERYRIHHAEYRDFLVASYLAKALQAKRFDRFGTRGFTVNIFRLTALLLKDFTIDEALVSDLMTYSEQNQQWFVFGNVGALIGNSRIPIDGPAIDLLIRSLRDLAARGDILGRLVMLAAWGYRALKAAVGDGSAPALTRALVEVLAGLAYGSEVCDPITRSTAWCYLKAFKQLGGAQCALAPYPDELDTDAARAVALGMIFELDENKRMSDRSRDFQTAFLEMQYSASADPDRPISAVHYLYCICCAYHDRKHIQDIALEVPRLVAPGSKTDKMVTDYHEVPELSRVLDNCRRLMEDGVSPCRQVPSRRPLYPRSPSRK